MMIGNQLRNSRFTIVSAAGIIFVFLLSGLVYNHLGTWDIPIRPSNASPIFQEGDAADLADNVNNSEAFAYYFEHMYKPTIKPSTVKYRPHNAFKWELKDEPKFPEPMGQDLCIIDLDNRPFDQPHELFGPDIMSWADDGDVHGLSLGVINHWIYAKIHGYKYYYVAIEDPGDRRASWKKPTIIAEILKKHKTCIYLDSDAIFYRLDLPFEWLMNYWRLDPEEHSLALAEDPNRDFNKDKFGKLYLNTGFIIAQNNKKTYDIMDAWDKCPEEGDPYPECVEFRKANPGRPTDQGGFGTYVRYTYEDNIKTLPCMEANGFPLSDSECHGTFIRHLWTGKDDWIKVEVGAQTPGPYLEMFHRQYLAEKKDFYVTEKTLLGK